MLINWYIQLLLLPSSMVTVSEQIQFYGENTNTLLIVVYSFFARPISFGDMFQSI